MMEQDENYELYDFCISIFSLALDFLILFALLYHPDSE